MQSDPKLFRKSLTLLIIGSLLISLILNIARTEVNAAGVTVSVSSPTNGEFAALTATNVTFGYNTTIEYSIADTISVGIAPAVASAVTNCTSPTTNADGDGSVDGSFGSFSTTGATYTFTAATTQAVSSGVDLCLRFASTTATGIYSIGFTDSNGDFGATLIYVGDDNDVTVTATVTPLLSMAIRNSGDTGDTNACDLGTLTTSAVNTCAYRIKVNTNANSGYTVTINSDGDLRKSGSGDVADAEDLDPIVENNTVTAGTEGYGIAFNGGAATGGAVTESGNFNDDDTPIPISSATNLYTSNGPNNPGASGDTTNTALVTHRATVDAGTETGNYSHIVTYLTSASF